MLFGKIQERDETCSHENAVAKKVDVPFKLDYRILMKFQMFECPVCDRVFATEDQRQENAKSLSAAFAVIKSGKEMFA